MSNDLVVLDVATIDLHEAARFLSFMAEGEPVTFQTFDDDAERKSSNLARILHGDLDQHASKLLALNERGAGIFWMVNHGNGKGREGVDVTGIRAVFLDLDGAPLQPVLAAGLDPHAVIESSPGKWHVYWMVSGCNLAQFKPVQLALAAKFGGDPSVNDLPRVLRVPGFLHRKGEPFMSRIVSMEPLQPYRLDELVQRLELDLSVVERPRAAPRVDPQTGEIGVKVTHPGRHKHLSRKLADLNWRGIPTAGIRLAIYELNERECDPPKTHAEVDALVDDWVARYRDEHGRDLRQPAQLPSSAPAEDADHHRNVPQPDPNCLYGLVGDIARAASATTEANPYAVALNALAYIGCCVGRGAYMSVGNTGHHPRLFGLHVGRSGSGRKGEAMTLLHRIDMALRAGSPDLAPQVHRGGLSSREGLAYLIHDGFREGKNEVEPIHDKRLWIIESEFANVLHQTKRDGNTLSAALRDCWDGVGIKPATKSNRISASHPHISLSAAVTQAELLSLIEARELSNGFANRFVVIFNERQRLIAFPTPTPQAEVDGLAARLADVLRNCGADRWVDRDHLAVAMTPAATKLYGSLYMSELNRCDAGPLVTSLLERRAPVLLRIAMLLALTDKTTLVSDAHIMAALAWVRYWSDSVKFIFSSAAGEDAQREVTGAATKIVEFLRERGRQSRTAISIDCFQGKLSKDRLDEALSELLQATPPAINVESEPRKTGPGAPTKFYALVAKSAKSAKCEEPHGSSGDSERSEISEMSEVSGAAAGDDATTVRSVRSVRHAANQAEPRANPHTSLNSLNSLTGVESAADTAVFE